MCPCCDSSGAGWSWAADGTVKWAWAGGWLYCCRQQQRTCGGFLARKGALGFTCVALMPASFCGLPQNKRCSVICLAFSSVKTLLFICLHIQVFPPYGIKTLPTTFLSGGITVNYLWINVQIRGSSGFFSTQAEQCIWFQFAFFSPVLLMLPFPMYTEQPMFLALSFIKQLNFPLCSRSSWN